ncbi:MAG: diaminopimelate epimerase [Balneolaceae bacterium]
MNLKRHIPFTKMQGAGNDFILFDNRAFRLNNEQISALAPAMCSRRYGIGSDGLIALEFDESQQADLIMIYKNPDGSDAGMCGNGARCFAAFASTLGCPDQFTFRVHDNVYRAEIDAESVRIHFPLTTRVEEIEVDDHRFLQVYTNTEHVVCAVKKETLSKERKLVKKGRSIRQHDVFAPLGTNVNFICGSDHNLVHLQTYERGVEDLTLACGTGAIASALAWHYLQNGSEGSYRYKVDVKGGELIVHFTYSDKTHQYSTIQLEGPATFVFEGHYYT